MISPNEPIRIFTETGSIYEYDPTTSPKRVRRLHGRAESTPRVGAGGEWKECHAVDASVGFSAVIDWSGFATPSVPGATPCTVTSRVFRIEPVAGAGDAS